MEMEEEILSCPRCGSPLAPLGYQEGLYLCEFCGEVEGDDEGFVVAGVFYPADVGTEGSYEGAGPDWEAREDDSGERLTLGDIFGGIDSAGDFGTDVEVDIDELAAGYASGQDDEPLPSDLAAPEDDADAFSGKP